MITYKLQTRPDSKDAEERARQEALNVTLAIHSARWALLEGKTIPGLKEAERKELIALGDSELDMRLFSTDDDMYVCISAHKETNQPAAMA
jgi:hypothetical protein